MSRCCLITCVLFAAVWSHAGGQPKPDGKTDIEQLQGLWELKVKQDGIDYVLRLEFGKKGYTGFDIFRPVELNAGGGGLIEQDGDKTVRYFGGSYGMDYKLAAKDGKRVIVISDCLAFPTKAAELSYEFKDGELVIKCEKLKIDLKRPAELDLSGTWKRKKVQ